MEQHEIPEFMQGYYQEADIEAKDHLEQLAAKYADEKATFLQTSFVQKQQFQRDWNRLTGQRKELTVEEALRPMQNKYGEQAKEIVEKYRHVEPESPKDDQQPQMTEREAFLQQLQQMRENAKMAHRPHL